MKKATDINQNGLPEEENSLGLESGTLPNGSITASSSWGSSALPSQGRLRNDAKGDAKFGAWCSKQLDKNQYLEVDLGEVTKVGAIATQGRPEFDEDGGWFVQTYTIAFSNDAETWNNYKEFGIVKVFEGNKDTESISVNRFKMPVTARHIRIKPVTWYNHIALRVELYKDTKSKTSPAKGKSMASSRSNTDQRRSRPAGATRDMSDQRPVVNGLASIQIVPKDTNAEEAIEDVVNHVTPQEEISPDKQSTKPISLEPQISSQKEYHGKTTFAAGSTGSQERQRDTRRPNSTSSNEGDDSLGSKTYSRLIKQASATVTSSQGEKYIGRIKLIKKDASQEPEAELKKDKKEIDCEIAPIVRKRIKDMSSGQTEQTENKRKSIILDEEIKYTEDMEAKVNERVEMFREAEKIKKEREEAEKLKLEKKRQEKERKTEEAKRKMQDSSDGSPTHSEGAKSDVSEESPKNGPLNMAEITMKTQNPTRNGALGESWENLSIGEQDESEGSIELEKKLESIQTEHEGYDPEKERSILEQTEEAFRTYASREKNSPVKKAQGTKTSMLIKSFSVAQESSEKSAPLKRQLSEPRTPVKTVMESDDIIPVTAIDTESAVEDDLTSSSSAAHDDTKEIEIGFVRKASERYRMAAENNVVNDTRVTPEPNDIQVSEVIEEPQQEAEVESMPLMEDLIQEEYTETVESEPAFSESTLPESPRSAQSSESDLKDIESGLVRRVTQRFKESHQESTRDTTPTRSRPKPMVNASRTIDIKERSGSSTSEVSEPRVSESMSLEFLMKEFNDTQLRVQGSERHVSIAKERLEQCSSAADSSEGIEAEEEYHEACLELSRLRKKLIRLQKEIKETANDVEIDFKSLDRSGAPLVAPTLRVDRESVKVSRECKAPVVKEAPPVDTSVFNDEGECVPEGNVLSQIKIFEKMKAAQN